MIFDHPSFTSHALITTPILVPLPKSLVIPRKRKPIPHIINLDLLHRLLTPFFTDINSLNVRLQALLARQLQHGNHLGPTANMTAANLRTVGRKILRHDLRQRLVRQSHIVELAVDRERAHVFLQVELVGHVGGVEDEVEGERPRFGPVLVFGADELFGPERERVLLLFRRVGDGVDFGAEGRGPEEAEVAESTTTEPRLAVGTGWSGLDLHGHSENGDFLAGPRVGADQRAVGCDTCAEHGRRFLGGDVVGDLEGEVLVGAYVARVASLSHRAVRIGGIVGIWSIDLSSFQVAATPSLRTNLLRAVVLIVAFADLAF